MIWDWSALVNGALGAGFGTAIITALIPMYREWTNRRSHAAYMAMRLAAMLEYYAYLCDDFLATNASAETPPEQEFPDWTIDLPKLPSYPDILEGWRAIDVRLADKCLTLRNEIYGAQSIIRLTIEYDMDDLGDTLREQAASLGLKAWMIASDLRKRHGVRSFEDHSHVIQRFEKIIADTRDAIEQRHQRATEFNSRFDAAIAAKGEIGHSDT